MKISPSGNITISMKVAANQSTPVCYAERLKAHDQAPHLLNWLQEWHTGQPVQKKQNNSGVTIDAIGFQESSQPLVIDPHDNFQTRAIQNLEINVTKNENRIGDYVVSCNLQYENIPEYARYARFIWFGIIFYNDWVISGYKFQNLSFSDKNPKPASFPKANHLNSTYGILVIPPLDILTDYGNHTILTHELISEGVFISETGGGLVVCGVYTQVGLFVKHKVIPPKISDKYRVVKSPLHVTKWKAAVSVALALIWPLIITCVVHYFRVGDSHRVVISVIKRMQHTHSYSPLGSSEGSTSTDFNSGYLPMAPLPTGRAATRAHQHQRLESVPEGEIISPMSEPRPSTDNVFFPASPTQPLSPRSKYPFDRSTSQSSAESQLGITVNPDEECGFDIAFSHMKEGAADSVLVKSRNFHVNVPIELEVLKVSSRRLKIGEIIGSGNFGMVYRAQLTKASGPRVDVAVKMLKDNATFEVFKDLIVEATCMAMVGSHENIVTLKAVCFNNKPCLATELCVYGDLKKFLANKIAILPEEIGSNVYALFYQWTMQIASGVNFLHGQKLVHRDLACRNILLDETLCCKVSDFGLARDLSDADYYKINSSTALPYRWLAPEIFQHSRFTLASDVWSFGVTVWEIFSCGAQPYADKHSLRAVSSFVQSGGKVVMPSDTDSWLAQLLYQCLSQEAAARPRMCEVLPALGQQVFKYAERGALVKNKLLEQLLPATPAR